MEANHNNMEELQEIAPAIANLNRQNLFFIPVGYFDSLAELIITNIRLAQFKKENPYSAPIGYFENLPDLVINKIHLIGNEVYQELSEVAPLLNTIGKSNVFSFSEGYFNNILEPTLVRKEIKTRKVVSFGDPIRKWLTYAAAASVLFIIAITAYLYIDIHGRNFEDQLPIEQRISELNEQEIMNYLKDNDGITSGDLIIPAADDQDPQIQHLLENTSDEDLENYLDEYSEPNEKPVKGI
jgi:hypothetical protein